MVGMVPRQFSRFYKEFYGVLPSKDLHTSSGEEEGKEGSDS